MDAVRRANSQAIVIFAFAAQFSCMIEVTLGIRIVLYVNVYFYVFTVTERTSSSSDDFATFCFFSCVNGINPTGRIP